MPVWLWDIQDSKIQNPGLRFPILKHTRDISHKMLIHVQHQSEESEQTRLFQNASNIKHQLPMALSPLGAVGYAKGHISCSQCCDHIPAKALASAPRHPCVRNKSGNPRMTTWNGKKKFKNPEENTSKTDPQNKT